MDRFPKGLGEEMKGLRIQTVQDHAPKTEDVHAVRRVGRIRVEGDLRSHVPDGAQERCVVVLILTRTVKVDETDVMNVVQDDVFWLDVVVIDVMVVEEFHGRRHLGEDVEQGIDRIRFKTDKLEQIRFITRKYEYSQGGIGIRGETHIVGGTGLLRQVAQYLEFVSELDTIGVFLGEGRVIIPERGFPAYLTHCFYP